MAKTGSEIQGDVYRLLRDSTLYEHISGEVYRGGKRPRDSRKEDAVVVFTAGLPTQIESGVVTVNVYVPDTDFGEDYPSKDGDRIARLERLCQQWVDSLTAEVSCYKFELQRTITDDFDPQCGQHFIVVRLYYRYYGGEDDTLPVVPPQLTAIVVYDENGDKRIVASENDEAAVVYPRRPFGGDEDRPQRLIIPQPSVTAVLARNGASRALSTEDDRVLIAYPYEPKTKQTTLLNS